MKTFLGTETERDSVLKGTCGINMTTDEGKDSDIGCHRKRQCEGISVKRMIVVGVLLDLIRP